MIQIHLYLVASDWHVTKNEQTTLTIHVYKDKDVHMFQGRVCHLQAWCAKREISYEHRVLNIPIEE